MPIVVGPTPSVDGGEQIVLDPSEIATDRVEVDITSWISADGPSWGDAEIEQYMAEAQRGQLPIDYRLPNRRVEIPLVMRDTVSTSFETMRAYVQAKAALFQQEGGWLKRETSIGPVYMDVVGATLHLSGDVFQAWHSRDIGAVLTLEVLPDFYGDEIELADNVETTAGELVFAHDGIVGDYPGRLRLVVDEDQGVAQLGLLYGLRSRHYSPASTAQMVYEAENLDPLDAAATATVAGQSVVRHQSLSTDWTPVLSMDVGGTVPLTHTGTNRVWARVYSESSTPQLRLLWDVGDLVAPEENSPVEIPGLENFYLVDLGEVRLDPPVAGAHQWRGVVQAKGVTAGVDVSIEKVYVVPVDEAYGVLRAPLALPMGFNGFTARDEFDQSTGNLSGKTLPVGGTWAGAGDSTDFAVNATDGVLERTATSDVVQNGRFALAGTTVLDDTAVQADFQFGSTVNSALTLGIVVRYTDTATCAVATLYPRTPGTSVYVLSLRLYPGGGSEDAGTAVVSQVLTPDTWYTLRVLVLADGTFGLWLGPQGSPAGAPVLAGISATLATGGALESGRVGLYDEWVAGLALTRRYDNFTAWTPDKDAVLFADQSAELRWDGIERENADGTGYGRIVPIGNLPRIPTAGLEARTVEFFLKASRGELDQLPDSAIDDLSARVYYRPSWLFVATS